MAQYIDIRTIECKYVGFGFKLLFTSILIVFENEKYVIPMG